LVLNIVIVLNQNHQPENRGAYTQLYRDDRMRMLLYADDIVLFCEDKSELATIRP